MHQTTMFTEAGSNSQGCETIVLQESGLDAEYQPNFVDVPLAQTWFDDLLVETAWRQDVVTVYGKRHLAPRLSCWMAEGSMVYSYSNNAMVPKPWTELVQRIKGYVEAESGETFNSVLINYYRDGQDSNGWHADNEPELGEYPTIASVSLGGARDFHLRKKSDHSQKHKINLEHASLLMMRGETQLHWQHQVPKRAVAEPRINLTFRHYCGGR